MSPLQAILLDRDGVINRERADYVNPYKNIPAYSDR